MNPLVSIILPVYNSNKKFLVEAIESIINQTYKNFELIIINDNSTNNIEKTIIKYQKKDTRIIYLKNMKNLQLPKTLNKGINISKGKYIVRIDDDDIRNKNDKLEKQINFMESNKEYGLCGTGRINLSTRYKKKEPILNTDKEIRRKILTFNPITHSSVVIKKSALKKVGLYNPKYNGYEDWELWLRIGKKFKLYNIPEYLTTYRHRDTSIMGKAGNNFFKRLIRGSEHLRMTLKYSTKYPGILRSLPTRLFYLFSNKWKKNTLEAIRNNYYLNKITNILK